MDTNTARGTCMPVPISDKQMSKGVVATADGQVTRYRTIGLDTVFEEVELPAGIAHLDTALVKIIW